MSIRKSILITVIIAACLASYFNTLFADFVGDDNIFITPNSYMKSFRFLPLFFINDFGHIGTERKTSSYYRPLLAASYMLDYALWGNNPFGFHLTNLLFHILFCVLMFSFIELILQNRIIAFTSTLLFSVHPVHTEAVSFISGRVDVVPPVFFMLSLVLFIHYASNRRLWLYLLSLVSFFIALLVKEMVTTLPLIILCIDYLFLSQGNARGVFKNFFRFHIGFFVTLGIYLIVRSFVVGGIFVKEVVNYGINFVPGTNPFWRLFTVIKVFTLHIRLLFFPYELHTDYKFPPANSLFEPIVLIGLFILILFFSLAIKNMKRYPILSFSIFWFFITILPVSNIIPRGNIFAERFMYLPSVGFCIAIGFLFSGLLKKDIKTRLLNWRKSLYIVFFLLIIALGRVTYERNKVWNNDFSLWYDTVKASPNSEVAHINLAVQYSKMNLFNKAIEEAKISIELNPLFYEAIYILGHIYLKKGLLDEAAEEFKKMTAMIEYSALAYNGLAIIYINKGQYKQAIESALTALDKNPYLDVARYNLALSYLKAGLIDEAIATFKQYLITNANDGMAYNCLAFAYGKKGQYGQAIEAGLMALDKDPHLDEARYNLALSYSNVGLIDESINTYEEYLKTNHNFPNVHVDVGKLYYQKGNYQKAKEHWFIALRLNENYQPAKDALKLLEN